MGTSWCLFDAVGTASILYPVWRLTESRPQLWLNARNVRWPVVSPNGKWIAYVSTESGRSNVYVQPFDPRLRAGFRKIAGVHRRGIQPAWRADGKELYYLSPDNMLMAASVKPGKIFNYERPVALFDIQVRLLRGPRSDYATP